MSVATNSTGRRHAWRTFTLPITLLLVWAPGRLLGQCQTGWIPEFGSPGMNNSVTSLLALPNDELVAGGNFILAGGIAANFIARHDGSTWAPLGSGMNSSVDAMVRLPNGDIIAGGNFTTAGGIPANRIARWDGVAWSALGAGTNSYVNTLALLPNGDVAVGGNFTSAGGVAGTARLARWDGSSWHPIGAGLPAAVRAAIVLPNGDLVVGGSFFDAGGVPGTRFVARWDGTTWSALGTGVNGAVDALALLPNGDIVAGGSFNDAGGTPNTRSIARWDGATWSALGTGMDDTVRTLLVTAGGDLIAGGSFRQAGGVRFASKVARWDGTAWLPVSNGIETTEGPVQALAAASNGDLWVGGSFSRVMVPPPGFGAWPNTGQLVRWHASANQFRPLNRGLNWDIHRLLSLPDGDLVACGVFAFADGQEVQGLARWDGQRWHRIGDSVSAGFRGSAAARLANGDLLVGHPFAAAGSSHLLAHRFDGTAWTPSLFGSDYTSEILTMLTLADGTVLAGGYNPLSNRAPLAYRFDGAWHADGTLAGGWVFALAQTTNGHVYAGGNLSLPGVAAQHPLARSTDGGRTFSFVVLQSGASAWALLPLPNGDLIIGGNFPDWQGSGAQNIVRYDGTNWSPLGTGMNNTVHALARLPNGDIIAGGEFSSAGGVPAAGIARWNGTGWSAVNGGLSSFSPVRALAVLTNEDLAVGGSFRQSSATSGPRSSFFTILGCPRVDPTYRTFGGGCSGSRGVPGNTARAMPRLGRSMTIDLTDLPQDVALFILGFSNTVWGGVPLPYDLTAFGAPGCQWRVSDDLCTFVVGSGGSAEVRLQMPGDPAMLGLQFFTQCLALDTGHNALGWVPSDAAAATVGY